MTDTEFGTTTPAEDEFFDDAQDVFPGKEDLKDRLVAVWALENGQDQNAEGKRYATVKTVTLVLDDGPDGTSAETAIRDEEVGPNRVGPAPAELDLRWSTEGMVARLAPRVGKTWKPMIGRINSQKNKVKGRSPSWSISAPTEEDKIIAREHAGLIRAVSSRLETEAQKAADGAAFDV